LLLQPRWRGRRCRHVEWNVLLFERRVQFRGIQFRGIQFRGIQFRGIQFRGLRLDEQ
jgi:uncharacterized protein YjbI with pentapeptide repeats